MCEHLNIFGLELPMYGMMILLGIIVSNAVALSLCKKFGRDKLELLTIESYGIIGAFLGSKILFLIISFKDIDWQRAAEPKYLMAILSNGFVFYGGLVGAILFMMLSGKIHKLDVWGYIRDFIFMIPIPGSISIFFIVIMKEKSGEELFPVQLVEAALVLIIGIVLLVLKIKKDFFYTIETYLLTYSVVRFILEFFRYDAIRGAAFGLSTSQWISIVVFIGTIISITYRKKRNKKIK